MKHHEEIMSNNIIMSHKSGRITSIVDVHTAYVPIRPSGNTFLLDHSPFNWMCLAIPGRVMEIEAATARVDFGYGTIRDVDVSLVDVSVGEYVLVHTGYAIQVMDDEEAKKTIEIWREILEGVKPASNQGG